MSVRALLWPDRKFRGMDGKAGKGWEYVRATADVDGDVWGVEICGGAAADCKRYLYPQSAFTTPLTSISYIRFYGIKLFQRRWMPSMVDGVEGKEEGERRHACHLTRLSRPPGPIDGLSFSPPSAMHSQQL
jgi:hypothetical protein